MYTTFHWIFILYLWVPSIVMSTKNDDENTTQRLVTDYKMESDFYKLEGKLLKNYKPHLIPVYSHSTKINMSVILVIYALHEVSERYQTIRHFNWLSLKWKDEFLSWDPNNFNGIDAMEFPDGFIWTPNIVFSNSVTKAKMSSFYALVLPGGTVTWGPVGMQETMCTLDITFYPFDVQRCGIYIDLWTTREQQVNLTCISAQKADMVFMENSEWELTDLSMEYQAVVYDGDRYSRCYVSLFLKRRRLFHCLTLILPNGLLAVLASYVFVLPVECGEKLSFCMSLLLAFTLNLSVLISTMPHSSLNVSYLMIYLTCLSIATALSVITTAIMQKLYHENEKVTPSVKIAILSLAKLFRFLNTYSHQPEKESSENPDHQNEDLREIAHIHAMNKGKGNTVDAANEGLPLNYSNTQTHHGRQNPYRENFVRLVAAEDQLDAISRRVSREAGHLQGILYWRDAVVILDYVFFRVFLFVILAMTSGLTMTLFIGQ